MTSSDRSAYQKAWRAANVEKLRAYRRDNREKLDEQKKAWNAANADKILAMQRARWKLRDKVRRAADAERARLYRERNREADSASKKASRERIKANDPGGYAEKERERHRAWRSVQENRERERALEAAWKQQNPGRIAIRQAKHALARRCLISTKCVPLEIAEIEALRLKAAKVVREALSG